MIIHFIRGISRNDLINLMKIPKKIMKKINFLERKYV